MKILQSAVLVLLVLFSLSLGEPIATDNETACTPMPQITESVPIPEVTPYSIVEEVPDPNTGGAAYAGLTLTDEEIRLLSAMVFLEANTQCFDGQQAVVEVALNRVLSPLFPNTVYDVLFQPEQFSVAPLIESYEPTQMNIDAVYAALHGVSPVLDENVLYFSRSPQNDRIAAHIEDHYFCYQ